MVDELEQKEYENPDLCENCDEEQCQCEECLCAEIVCIDHDCPCEVCHHES